MSWCPNCRSEYVNGRTNCADCGAVLVESLDDIAEDTKDMFDFDSLSDEMKRRVLGEMQRENIDPRKVLNRAKEGTPEFIAQIIDEENSLSPAEAEEQMKQEAANEPGAFIKKEERMQEYRSSGYALLIVGIAGLAFILAELTGIIDLFSLSGGSMYLFSIVMTLMFAGFIMLGIRSFVTSSKLKKEASSENAYISELENWIHANIHADSINDGINQSLSIEELYPLRAEKIRSLLLSKDEQMDKAMLEHYVEQTYAALFESGSAQ